MSRKVISVIGSLSNDAIHKMNQVPERGAAAKSEKHMELGGYGANIAIAAWRSSHRRPDTEDGLLPPEPRPWSGNEDDIEVRMIGAVCDEDWMERFRTRMLQNGVEAEGIQIKEDATEQDYCTTFMDRKTGSITQAYNFETSNQWTEEDFDTIEKIGGGVVPDLVVVTMELRTKVVEHIISKASDAGVEIVLYASPGEALLADHYHKVTHLICDENDAAKMLGYRKLEDVNMDNWDEIVDNFYESKGVKHVVLKVGHLGAFFKNDEGDHYSAGYKRVNEIVDETGATAAFIGTYVVELLKHRHTGDWNMASAVARANAACAVVVSEVGYQTSLPWSDELDAIQDDPNINPLYSSIEDLRATPKKIVFGRTGRRL